MMVCPICSGDHDTAMCPGWDVFRIVDLRMEVERGWLEHAAMRQALKEIRRMCAPAVVSAWEAGWDQRATVIEARDLIESTYRAADKVLRFVDGDEQPDGR